MAPAALCTMRTVAKSCDDTPPSRTRRTYVVGGSRIICVTPCSSIWSSTARASNFPQITIVAPAERAHMNQLWPPWCSSGHWIRTTGWSISSMAFERKITRISAKSCPWVRHAPFGRPVEPPVNCTRERALSSQKSSRSGSAVSERSNRRGANGVDAPTARRSRSGLKSRRLSTTFSSNFFANTRSFASTAFVRYAISRGISR